MKVDSGGVIARAGEAAKAAGLGALVASSWTNVRWVAGTSFFTQDTHPDRLAFVLIFPDAEPVFIYCGIEEGQARSESWIVDQRPYVEFADLPHRVLAAALLERGALGGRVGLEMRHLSMVDGIALHEALPSADLVQADDVFDRLRAIKTPEELSIISEAALATDASIRAAFERACMGSTEVDIANHMVSECKARGGEKIQHLIVASGANGFNVHADPTKRSLAPGDVLRTDFGMTWGSYHSDVARTAFVGPLKPHHAESYKQLESVHQAIITAVQPGVTASRLYAVCVDGFARFGVKYQMPHVGHSIGIGTHEMPMLQPSDSTVLEPGMALMIEPGVFMPDGFCHTEDLIIVTESGHEVRSRSADWASPLVLE